MKLKLNILSLLFLINYSIYSQNQYFSFSATKASCEMSNGFISILALQQAALTYPFPWLVEVVHPDGSDSYNDLNGGLVIGELIKGNYQVRVWLDIDNGCKVDSDITIGNTDITIEDSAPIIICQPGTREIIPEVTGGTGVYTFEWSNG